MVLFENDPFPPPPTHTYAHAPPPTPLPTPPSPGETGGNQEGPAWDPWPPPPPPWFPPKPSSILNMGTKGYVNVLTDD